MAFISDSCTNADAALKGHFGDMGKMEPDRKNTFPSLAMARRGRPARSSFYFSLRERTMSDIDLIKTDEEKNASNGRNIFNLPRS